MKIIFSLAVILPMIINAQNQSRVSVVTNEQGIKFEHGLSWQQVKDKAKALNKYIFVDCYTTWCGPCKVMEKSVYPLNRVGDFFNSKFIAVKMQMDSSKMDDTETIDRYADAHYIQNEYRIEAYPTYLFFTSDGKLLSRDIGAKNADQFLSLAADVIDPKNNYYRLLEQFKQGKRDMTEMSFLARIGSMVVRDTANSELVVHEYTRHIKDEDLFTKDNIRFMNDFTRTSKDKGFKFFYRYADSIDKVMGDDTYAQNFVRSIIFKEIVEPVLDRTKKTSDSVPDWDAIRFTIQKKYNASYADRVTTISRLSWAYKHNNLPEYTKYLVAYEDKYGTKTNLGLMPSLILNNDAWAVFLYSNNKEELNSALSWSGRAVLMSPNSNWMDTYANLLYKLGRKEDAIGWEEIAAKLNPDAMDIQGNLEKMKKGIATWSVK